MSSEQLSSGSTVLSRPDRVVLTCAITGALADRRQCPAVPYSPAEIAEETRRAWEAGAAVAHIHARTDDGQPCFDPEVFVAIRDEVRSRCPIIINFSTGNLEDDTSLQEAMIARARPDIAALNMGTMNYAKYSPRRRGFVFDMIFPNPFSKIERLLRAMNEANVKPELECFDSGHTASAAPFMDMGLLKPPMQFSFIVNVLGGMPPSVQSLQFQKSLIPAGSEWEVIGISHCQWRMLAAALLLDGNIRCGLEDHFYLPSGEMAKSNGELCTAAVRLARTLGREPASVDEARIILGLGSAES